MLEKRKSIMYSVLIEPGDSKTFILRASQSNDERRCRISTNFTAPQITRKPLHIFVVPSIAIHEEDPRHAVICKDAGGHSYHQVLLHTKTSRLSPIIPFCHAELVVSHSNPTPFIRLCFRTTKSHSLPKTVATFAKLP